MLRREEAVCKEKEERRGRRREWRKGEGGSGQGFDCLPFEWKFRGLRVDVPVEWSGTYQIDTGPTQYIKDLIPDSPGYMDYSASSSPYYPAMSIHNHGPSLSLEIDLLFKVTRVSQCVFTTIRFRGRNTLGAT